MTNPKVYEFAKEIGMTPLALMDKIKEWHMPIKSHMSEIDPEALVEIKKRLGGSFEEEVPQKKMARKRALPKKAEGDSGAPKQQVIRRRTQKEAEPETPEVLIEAQSPKLHVHVEEEATAAPISKTKIEIESQVQAPTEGALDPGLGGATSQPSPLSQEAEEIVTPAAPGRKKEVAVGTSGIASSSKPVTQVRRNIVGRMDLSRVTRPPGAPSFGPRQSSSGGVVGGPGVGGSRPGGFASPRPGMGPRNIRAGFVAMPSPEDILAEADLESRKSKEVDRKSKRLSGAPATGTRERETEEVQDFNAVEFRKRELVFQPKKKKDILEREAKKTLITTPKASKRILKVYGSMRVSDVAQEVGLKAPQLIKALVSNGVMASMNTQLDFDTIALILPEFGWEAQNVKKTADDILQEIATEEGAETVLVPRPPVVTVMGHVDHGKTSLLDAIRNADVVSGEAGGITQHIGAYNVQIEDGSQITFLDTPGHEAFTAMRARGAHITDIAVIVVAADDGMMPQTQEAINHAKAAGVPIIVAVNKMDKPGANPERIKQQLTELEIVPEEWGGTTIFCPVSALKRTGIKELLENIKLVAEVQDLKADPRKSGTGVVIEAKMEKGKGSVATLLVKDGTIRIGQYLVAGTVKGRVRSLMNDRGSRLEEAGPGTPVEVLGLESVPSPGDRFDIVKDEATAERISSARKEKVISESATTGQKLSLEEIFSKVQKGDVKELAIILKADVQGSLEAVQGMIGKLVTAEVKTKLIHTAVGAITSSDVLLAHTSKGIIIGFNVRPDTSSQSEAKRLGVEIRTYSIVYELIDDLKKAMAGLLTPDVVEKILGTIEVRNTFNVPKIGTIAGCFVKDGKVQRNNLIRLTRDGRIIYEGKISSLKRFKDDAKEVAQGFECGIGIENFNDIKVGDVMESYIKEEVVRELNL